MTQWMQLQWLKKHQRLSWTENILDCAKGNRSGDEHNLMLIALKPKRLLSENLQAWWCQQQHRCTLTLTLQQCDAGLTSKRTTKKNEWVEENPIMTDNVFLIATVTVNERIWPRHLSKIVTSDTSNKMSELDNEKDSPWKQVQGSITVGAKNRKWRTIL